jgi:hypothetical protein
MFANPGSNQEILMLFSVLFLKQLTGLWATSFLQFAWNRKNKNFPFEEPIATGDNKQNKVHYA